MSQPSTAPVVEVSTAVRIRFAHASVQVVADRVGADVLHIKGASLDPTRNPGRAEGSDADVLVRPDHVQALMAGLRETEWSLWCRFDEGSLFEHAASLHHGYYGMLDVHQNFPGLHHDPTRSFDELWADRETRVIAGVECAAPGRIGEHLIMLLHAGRTPGKELDVRNHWHLLSEREQDEIRSAATRLGGTVGLEAALGHLPELVGPEADLWRLMLDNSDRLGEWRARWRASTGLRARAHLTVRALRVNRFVLGQELGHPPTRADVRREWWRRTGAGVRGVARLARRSR